MDVTTQLIGRLGVDYGPAVKTTFGERIGTAGETYLVCNIVASGVVVRDATGRLQVIAKGAYAELPAPIDMRSSTPVDVYRK